MVQSRKKAAGSRRLPRYAWETLSDDQLLSLRFCDLKLKVRGTELEDAIHRLYRELEMRGIRFRPHCWLAQEWFSPDGIPGIAIPFYLAHPRLMRIERRFMREVEGGNRNWLMRILRHEAGHAIDTAYRLRRRSLWRAPRCAAAPAPMNCCSRCSPRRHAPATVPRRRACCVNCAIPCANGSCAPGRSANTWCIRCCGS